MVAVFPNRHDHEDGQVTMLLRAALVAALLSLAGCGGGSMSEQVSAIQAGAIKLCGYAPTAASVLAVLTAGNPAVTGVTAIVTAICGAVSNPPLGLKSDDGKPCPQVNGVCIEGEFIEPKEGE